VVETKEPNKYKRPGESVVLAGLTPELAVRLQDFAGAEKHFHLLNTGFGREVELGQRTRLTGTLDVDADRFVAAAGPHFIHRG
jgi:hypothetical protein